MLAAAPGGPCRAELDLLESLPVSEATSLAFDLRGSRPRQLVSVGVAENADDPGGNVESRRFRAGDEWHPEGLRLSHLRKDWAPQAVGRLLFTAYPLANSQSKAPVYIRKIRLAGLGAAKAVTPPAVAPAREAARKEEAAAAPEASEEPVVVQMEEPRMEEVSPAAMPHDNPPPPAHTSWRLPSFHFTMPAFQRPHWHLPAFSLTLPKWSIPVRRLPRRNLALDALKALGAFVILGLGAWVLARRRPRGPAINLSPLYEMNTRTWKSHKDSDGVLHIGGFEKVTLADLKAIKANGFNSIWFMGIWEIGPKVRDISRRYGADYAGSPFAIYDYHVSQELGSEEEFQALIDRAHAAELRVIVDFVPNHMGLDSAWLNEHPEYFIHRVLDEREAGMPDSELENRYPGYFVYRTPAYPQGNKRVPKTIMVAYGKDPYFYPWIDTAQLDYAVPALRRHLIDLLSRWAQKVDGVRCDMAMLVLREQVKVHRHPEMSWETFNRLMPDEFWTEAIRGVKRVNPSFMFMAETYWGMEGYLQQLGFDYTYNKPLYEAMCHAFHGGHAEGLMNFLRLLGTDFLKRGVHFLENHDEERAMNSLGDERQRAAAAMIATLPGVALIHQGQMEGKRERLPVQRAVPAHSEPINTSLYVYYRRLLEVTSLPVFREGRLHVLYSNNPSLITYARIHDDLQALVIINTSNRYQKGSVFLTPGLKLKTGAPYKLYDIYYDLKPVNIREQSNVQPSYNYPAASLINQGLYVELHPFDAHLFLFEPRGAYKARERLQHFLRGLNHEMPLPRVARRLLSPALVRSSDNK